VKNWISLSLSGGKSSRFKSTSHKALHLIAGKNIASIIIDQVIQSGIVDNAIVVPKEHVTDFKSKIDKKIIIIPQSKATGTGDAIKISINTIKKYKYSLIINGDLPLITSKMLKKIIIAHEKSQSVMTLAAVSGDKYKGYGKLITKGNQVLHIEERKSYTAADYLNAGIYAVNNEWLIDNINKLNKAKTNELEFTSIVKIATKKDQLIKFIDFKDTDEALQINTGEQLASVRRIINNIICIKHISKGVEIVDPSTTYIDFDVKIGKNTIIKPNSFITGKTVIKNNCSIGPTTTINKSIIKDDTIIESSKINNAEINKNIQIGPFCQIRPGTKILNNVKIGSYVEIKNSLIGQNCHIGHFSYIGDTHIEESVNIGAGTVTANYDGKKKYKTYIGKNTFIGSNATLVAPIKLGKNVFIGAGSVVINNVNDNQTLVGNPAKSLKK
jgi:bifunctional UDP-N-acetylglucosamine pyrophosphorylase/glucosamine-1-phosphate N-acetyltransferase